MSLLALVVNEADRMLALLVQLLAHRRVVPLRLRQRVVWERVLLAILMGCAARTKIARLGSHALI